MLNSYTVRVCSCFTHAVIQFYLVDPCGLWAVEMSATSYQRFLPGDFVGRKSEESFGGIPAEARREERAENCEGPDWPWIGEARQCRGHHRCRTSPKPYFSHWWARGLQSFPWEQVISQGTELNEYFLHRSTIGFLMHDVRASYSDDIFQLSLNQKV